MLTMKQILQYFIDAEVHGLLTSTNRANNAS